MLFLFLNYIYFSFKLVKVQLREKIEQVGRDGKDEFYMLWDENDKNERREKIGMIMI